MPEQNFTKIGNYDVVGVIGEGGMGIVYKGWDPRFDRPVAIKMMTTGYSKNAEALRRFDSEARSVGKLQHPNIVIVYDVGNEAGTPYLVMEYLDGESLDKIITVQRELSIVEKLHIIVRVLRALHYAHQRGIVHRDVKPGNVMVLPDGDCKLVDFGIARAGDTNLTHTGQIIGSMSYMSPEQLNGYDVDGRTDVWSAGVLLYQLLTYHLPFEGRDTSALIVKILSDNPPPLSTYIERYPAELDEIIRRALSRDRDARYATAEEFAFDLDRIEGLLKAQMVSDYVEQARVSIDSDLGRARELLSRVLKVDTQNSTAKQMLYQVQQLMQQQQRSEQVQLLRSRAEEELDKANWEDALSLTDQALKLDPTNLELVGLRESILRWQARKEQVLKLVRLAEAAHQAGELEMARRAVDDALTLDPNDTQARVLGTALVREIEQRRRFEELLQSVRGEVSASRFEQAARLLREAEALCPQATEIPPLKNLIAGGREEQIRTERVESLRQEAEQLLARKQFAQAQAKAEEALRYDHANRAVLDLLERIKTLQHDHWVAQQLAASEKLVAEGRITAALTLLESAGAHSHDARLQSQIPILRQKLEQKRSAALAAAIASAKEASQRNDHAAAIAILERTLSELGRSKEVEQLLVSVQAAAAEAATRREQIEDTLHKAQSLLDNGAIDQAEALLSTSLAAGLKDERIDRLLASVRARRQEINRNLEIEREAAKQEAAKQEAVRQEAVRQEAARQEAARQREKLIEETRQKAKVQIEHGDLEGAIAYLESAAGQIKDERITQQLAEARSELDRRRRSIDAVATQARKLLEEEKPAAAIALLESQPRLYGESPTLREVLERAKARLKEQQAREVRERKASQKVPREEIAVPGPPPQTQPGELSATRLFSPSPSGDLTAAEATRQPVVADSVVAKPPQPAPVKAATTGGPVKPVGRQFNKLLIAAGLAAALVLTAGLYLFLRPSGHVKVQEVSVSFETDPTGVEVSAGGTSCTAPCALNLKPGDYPVKASLAGYEPLEKEISVGKSPETIALKLTASAPALGSVQVKTNVDDVDLLVDGKLKGESTGKSAMLSLVPGNHQIRAEKSGYDAVEQTVEIASNSVASVQFTLNKAQGPAQPARNPFLVISGRPGAKVVIDGKRAGSLPADGIFSTEVKPGKHLVELGMDGYQPWSASVNADLGETIPVRAELKVLPKPPASIISFSADTGGIQQGQSTELRWRTLNARDVTIAPGIGSVEAAGSKHISPASSTTYTLTARGEGPPVQSSVTIRVMPAPAPAPKPSIVLFESGSDTVEEGHSTRLSWATQNATEVSIDQGIGAVGVDGYREVTPSRNTTYTLTARGQGGSETKSVQIKVQAALAPPPTLPPTSYPEENPEVKAVMDTIEHRYKDAYESMVIGDVKAVWPTMSKQQKDGINSSFKMFRAIKARYECARPTIHGETAQCACKESVDYTTMDNRRMPAPTASILFDLKKYPDGKWYIQNRIAQ